MTVVGIIGFLTIMAIPLARKAQRSAYQRNCLNNLRIIDQAKQQAALELRLATNANVGLDQLTNYFQRAVPACASAGPDGTFESSYQMNDVSIPASCRIEPEFHKLP